MKTKTTRKPRKEATQKKLVIRKPLRTDRSAKIFGLDLLIVVWEYVKKIILPTEETSIVVLHKRPHPDELAILFLFNTFPALTERFFKMKAGEYGIEEVDTEDENLKMKGGFLLLGCGHSVTGGAVIVDEHELADKGHNVSAVLLVAMIMGVLNEPGIAEIVSVITEYDRSRTDANLVPGRLSRLYDVLYTPLGKKIEPEEVYQWFHTAITAWYQYILEAKNPPKSWSVNLCENSVSKMLAKDPVKLAQWLDLSLRAKNEANQWHFKAVNGLSVGGAGNEFKPGYSERIPLGLPEDEQQKYVLVAKVYGDNPQIIHGAFSLNADVVVHENSHGNIVIKGNVKGDFLKLLRDGGFLTRVARKWRMNELRKEGVSEEQIKKYQLRMTKYGHVGVIFTRPDGTEYTLMVYLPNFKDGEMLCWGSKTHIIRQKPKSTIENIVIYINEVCKDWVFESNPNAFKLVFPVRGKVV